MKEVHLHLGFTSFSTFLFLHFFIFGLAIRGAFLSWLYWGGGGMGTPFPTHFKNPLLCSCHIMVQLLCLGQMGCHPLSGPTQQQNLPDLLVSGDAPHEPSPRFAMK